MIYKLINIIIENNRNWSRFQELFVKKEINFKTLLLREGEIAIQKALIRGVF